MNLNPKELRYFKHRCYGGKSTSAHLLDCILGSLMLLIFLFFLLRYLGAPIRGAALLSLCLCASILLFCTVYRRYRLERFISAELDRLRRTLTLEALVLLPDEEYREICRALFLKRYPTGTPVSVYHGIYFKDNALFCYAFHNHPQIPVGIRQMLSIYRKLQKLNASTCCLITPSTYVDDARAFSERLGVQFCLLGQKELLHHVQASLPTIDAQKLHQALQEEMHQYYAKTNLKHTAFAPNKYRAYLTCAFFLICWYFLFRISPLYPIAAGICCLFAACSYHAARKQRSKEESSDVFPTDGK